MVVIHPGGLVENAQQYLQFVAPASLQFGYLNNPRTPEKSA
jgi:hypothetical protein